MNKLFTLALGALFLSFGLAAAQTTSYPVETLSAPASALWDADSSVTAAPRVWFGADYLLWWVKDAPNRVPLVTTGPFDPNTFSPAPIGAIGSPGTGVLYGGGDQTFGTFTGLRVQAGLALDGAGLLSVEGGAFLLEKRSQGFAAQSDASGQPFLGRPVVGALSGQEGTLTDAFANDALNFNGGLAGAIAIQNSIRLWGGEANLAGRLYHDGGLAVTGLLGFRYLDLDESLGIQETFSPFGQPLLGGFNGQPVAIGDTVIGNDHFRTRNQFYGGQVGARVGYNLGLIDVNVLGKVALGDTVERISITGTSTLLSTGQVLPGDVLALPSNSGVYHHTVFAIVPEVGVNLGVQLTSWMRVQTGYSFLYLSQAIRPNNVIDRVIDRSEVPTLPNFVPGAVGIRPLPMLGQTDFWAHGLNFSLLVSF